MYTCIIRITGTCTYTYYVYEYAYVQAQRTYECIHVFHSQRKSDFKYLNLQTPTEICSLFWVAGTPSTHGANLCEIFGLPRKRVWHVRGLPWKLIRNYSSRNCVSPIYSVRGKYDVSMNVYIMHRTCICAHTYIRVWICISTTYIWLYTWMMRVTCICTYSFRWMYKQTCTQYMPHHANTHTLSLAHAHSLLLSFCLSLSHTHTSIASQQARQVW